MSATTKMAVGLAIAASLVVGYLAAVLITDDASPTADSVVDACSAAESIKQLIGRQELKEAELERGWMSLTDQAGRRAALDQLAVEMRLIVDEARNLRLTILRNQGTDPAMDELAGLAHFFTLVWRARGDLYEDKSVRFGFSPVTLSNAVNRAASDHAAEYDEASGFDFDLVHAAYDACGISWLFA